MDEQPVLRASRVLHRNEMLKGKNKTTADQGAFESAVRPYLDDLYRFAYWLSRDRWRAEDLVQETLARAWRGWLDLREVAALKAWLFTILHREWARSFAKPQPVDTDPGDATLEQSFEFDPVRALDLRDALHALPDASRAALLLQVLGGFSCAEIAAMLDTSEGAVMTRLTRTRQALRQTLSVDGPGKEARQA